jgi:hypothetical protein
MMSRTSFSPPRIATWLVDLFASDEQAESITGDLIEGFSEQASKSGLLPVTGIGGRVLKPLRISSVVDFVSHLGGLLVSWSEAFYCTGLALER